jgi:hypothetical protein
VACELGCHVTAVVRASFSRALLDKKLAFLHDENGRGLAVREKGLHPGS